MFVSISIGCENAALIPDVCKTPAAPEPVALPYPNIAFAVTHIPAQIKVMAGIGLMETIATEGTVSVGDEPGELGGVVSEECMGPDRYLFGSLKVMVEGFFVARLTSPTGHNGMPFNTTGMQVTPGQFHVLVLC